jgi:Tfp pilus assembly PilM family ATPase
MTQARKGWIGVDLGARAIKLAQLERDGRGVRLSAAAVLQRELPVVAGADGCVSAWSPRELRAALALEPNFRGRAAAGVLSALVAGARMLELPPGSDAELRSMIGQHLQETLGPDAADCEFDYWDAAGDGGQHTTLGVVYAPRAAALAAARNFSAAGLSCELLDGLPTALARAVSLLHANDDEPVALVDWGYARVTFVATRCGRPSFVRLLRQGEFGALVRSASQELELPAHDVEQLLALYGVHADEADESDAAQAARLLGRFVSREMLALEQELLRTLEHLRLHRPALAPARIILCGGGATIAGVDAVLAMRLDLPVAVWRLPPPADGAAAAPRACQPLLAGAAALSALAWTAGANA